MKSIITNSLNYIYKLKNKIAFYPTILSLAGLLFAFLLIYLESKGISRYLVDHAPTLVVNNDETARTLLTTFIAGLISIMVFSFSMVMVVLNQASSNFSPRLLPGLISDKKHQIILGFYTGTILYSVIILMSLGSYKPSEGYTGFSTILAAMFGVMCVTLFVYFIHIVLGGKYLTLFRI